MDFCNQNYLMYRGREMILAHLAILWDKNFHGRHSLNYHSILKQLRLINGYSSLINNYRHFIQNMGRNTRRIKSGRSNFVKTI